MMPTVDPKGTTRFADDTTIAYIKQLEDENAALKSAMTDGWKELVARTQWQPIETAPKDGTWFLGYGAHEEEVGPMEVQICPISWSKYGRWYNCSQYPSNPTHWQPLPQPPKE